MSVSVPAKEVTNFTLTFDFENGVGVEMEIRYPKGHAVSAINAIRQAGENNYTLGIMEALKDDESIRTALDALGVAFDDEEDDW